LPGRDRKSEYGETMEFNLETSEGLSSAVAEAGSWAALSRTSGVSVTTLKSRALKFGVETPKPRAKTREERQAEKYEKQRQEFEEERAEWRERIKRWEAERVESNKHRVQRRKEIREIYRSKVAYARSNLKAGVGTRAETERWIQGLKEERDRNLAAAQPLE